METWLSVCLCVCHVDVLCPNDCQLRPYLIVTQPFWFSHTKHEADSSRGSHSLRASNVGNTLQIRYVILTVAWRPLANTFVQASGGMSATVEVLVFTLWLWQFRFDVNRKYAFNRKTKLIWFTIWRRRLQLYTAHFSSHFPLFNDTVQYTISSNYLRANYAASRYCFWQRLSVCVSVSLSAQNLENYWSEIDVTW